MAPYVSVNVRTRVVVKVKSELFKNIIDDIIVNIENISFVRKSFFPTKRYPSYQSVAGTPTLQYLNEVRLSLTLSSDHTFWSLRII